MIPFPSSKCLTVPAQSPSITLSLLLGPCSWRSSSLPLLPVTTFRAPALMSHSSSGSSPEIGMGRVVELQSRARHISYSPGALLRARHPMPPSSRLPFSSPLSIFSRSLCVLSPLPAPPLRIVLTPFSVSTPCLSTSGPAPPLLFVLPPEVDARPLLPPYLRPQA